MNIETHSDSEELRKLDKKLKDWDSYIHALHFVYWEVLQASTGFSLFELIYGVRGLSLSVIFKSI